GIPSLTSIVPNSGSVVGGWSATLTGGSFVPGMTVLVDGQSAEVAVETATSATIEVPESKVLVARSVDVCVSNIAGSASLPDGLTYIVPDDTLVIESDGDFGYLAQGATVALTIPVRNTGRFPVSVSGVSI